MSKETVNVIILVLGSLSRFPIMSQTIALTIGLIGAAIIILGTYSNV